LQRQVALNLLFDNIETDLIDKEKFVVQQTKTIDEMQSALNKLVDYCHVLHFVATQAQMLQSMER
jgi:hypothetical protein